MCCQWLGPASVLHGEINCLFLDRSVLTGTIKRKKSENLNPNQLLESFQDPEDPYRVVAFFVNTTWDTSICPTNNITFMDSRELYRCCPFTDDLAVWGPGGATIDRNPGSNSMVGLCRGAVTPTLPISCLTTVPLVPQIHSVAEPNERRVSSEMDSV